MRINDSNPKSSLIKNADIPATEKSSSQCSPTELLLRWYDRNSRILPWREHQNPYWTWISEIMLQQTRIETVIPYFQRFVENFPTISALANANEDLLLKLWEGLGYYNRVRNIQKAARIMVERHNGTLPLSYNELLELPGIGEYTAGAIASIAYGIPMPAVDGNVLRVMARFLCYSGDITKPDVKKILRITVKDIISKERPGDFNQAMMDLGATVCLPNTAPLCHLCPIRELCAGYREGLSLALPIKSSKKPRTVQEKTVLVLICKNMVLLRRRPATGLLAGMWEFPNIDGWLDQENVTTLLNEWGVVPLSIQKTENARHVFTHIEWHMQGYLVRITDTHPVSDCLWVEEAAVRNEHAIPSAFKSFSGNLAQWIEPDIEII